MFSHTHTQDRSYERVKSFSFEHLTCRVKRSLFVQKCVDVRSATIHVTVIIYTRMPIARQELVIFGVEHE